MMSIASYYGFPKCQDFTVIEVIEMCMLYILSSDKFYCNINMYSMHIIVGFEEVFKVSLK